MVRPGPREGAVLTVPSRLSYSQVSKYSECGERFRLSYGRGIKGANWYATVAGKVVHHITEVRDRNRLRQEGMAIGVPSEERDAEPSEPTLELEPVPGFKEAFLALLAEEEGHGVVLKASGKELKEMGWTGGPNKKDKAWWLKYGPEFPVLYERWRNASHWQIAMVTNADGEVIPAIELEVKLMIGEEEMVGYIDRIFYDPETGDFIILDIKTGQLPDSKLQLGDYRVAVLEQYGIDAVWGCYWYVSQPRGAVTETEEPVLDEAGEAVLFKTGPRKGQAKTTKVKTEVPAELEGKTTAPVSLHAWTREFMEGRYEMAREGIMAGVFMPNVTRMCRGCDVRRYCRAVGGDLAVKVPVRELFIAKREPKIEEIVVEEELTAVD